jgi:hypothetical protein
MPRPSPTFFTCAALVVVIGCGTKPNSDGSDRGTDACSTIPTPQDDATSVKWASMNEWAQAGDVRVRVAKSQVQFVPLTGNNTKYKSKEPELMVWLEVENTSKVKKILYERWGTNTFARGDKLTDEHGRDYRISSYGWFSGGVEGGLDRSTKYMQPGDPAFTDIVCFERPADAATELRLTLRAVQLDELTVFRFRLRAADWK